VAAWLGPKARRRLGGRHCAAPPRAAAGGAVPTARAPRIAIPPGFLECQPGRFLDGITTRLGGAAETLNKLVQESDREPVLQRRSTDDVVALGVADAHNLAVPDLYAGQQHIGVLA
jgi:hypothetical protein